MSEATPTEVVTPENPWDSIEIPDFPRSYTKVQKFKDRAAGADAGRQFTASGPKADIVVKMVLFGGYTRSEMAHAAKCSVSRVAEVIWTMEAAGLDVSKVVRNRKAADKAATEAAAQAEAIDEVVALMNEALGNEGSVEVIKPVKPVNKKSA